MQGFQKGQVSLLAQLQARLMINTIKNYISMKFEPLL